MTSGRYSLAAATALLVVAAAALSVAPPDVPFQSPALLAPNADHWLGTDRLGRDVAYTSLLGLGRSLLSAIGILAISLVLGCAAASVSVLTYERRLDSAIIVTVETIRAFPSVLLAVLFATLGAPVALSLIAYYWAPIWRLLRSLMIVQIRKPYFLSAQLFGYSRIRCVVTELLPNVWHRVTPSLSVLLAEILSVQAALEYLGLGVSLDAPSLGQILLQSVELGFVAPWIWLPALLFLIFVIVGLATTSRYMQRRRSWIPLV